MATVRLPTGWTQKEGDASSVTRKMNGIEAFFNSFTEQPECSHQVGGSMYLELEDSLSATEVHQRVRKAWIDLRSEQTILGTQVCPGSTFEYHDVKDGKDIEAWAINSLEVHTICEKNVDLDAQCGAKYRNERSELFLPHDKGNWADFWVFIPKEEPIERIGLSLRVHHALADSGTLAILASELRRLLASPLDDIAWGTPSFIAKQRCGLPVSFSHLVDKSIPMPKDEILFNPKRIRGELKLSQHNPALKAKTPMNESKGCSHLIRSLDKDQSKKLRLYARKHGMTITAVMHALVAARCGKSYTDEEPDESNKWYCHFLMDCRSVLTDKRNVCMSASTDLVLMSSYAKAMRLSKDGKDEEAILLLAKEAMDAYGPCKDLSYRAKAATLNDELFAEIGEAVPAGEYALDKMVAECYSDSILDERYIDVNVPTSNKGIATKILDYDTTLHLNVFGFAHIRTWSFLGITKVCLDYAWKFWPHDEAEQLLDHVVEDVIKLIE